MNIGVLDDNVAILDFIRTALELSGHRVQTFDNSTSFLVALLPKQQSNPVAPSFPFDLVIVDLIIQGDLPGTEVIQRIREVTTTQQLPIIVISATGVEQLAQVKHRFPDVVLLSKPFTIKTLLHVIEHLSAPTEFGTC